MPTSPAAFVDRDETGMVNAVLDQLARQLARWRVRPRRRVTRWPRRDDRSPEDRLIARFFEPLATHPGALGLSDDAAFLTPPPGYDLVLKTDAIVGGVHFFPRMPRIRCASKALRVNLSDLGRQRRDDRSAFLLSLALPREIGDDWLERFCATACAATPCCSHCPLFGGDTDRTPGPISDFALRCSAACRKARWCGALAPRPGDRVFVSGTIGDAALGLMVRKRQGLEIERAAAPASRFHAICCRSRATRWPKPCACTLRRRWISPTGWSAISPSCAARPVLRPIFDVPRVPSSDAAKAVIAADPAALESVLTGGDDYEIVCTVPPAKAGSFRAAARGANVRGQRRSARSRPVRARASRRATAARSLFKRASFSHF